MSLLTCPPCEALGCIDYRDGLALMQAHVQQPRDRRPERLWALTHPAVFTQGLGGKPEHVLAPDEIPVVASDRGGQVTYHGPGQAVLYTLIDIGARRLGVRRFVRVLESSVIALLAEVGVDGARIEGAPGVYVDGAKVAALGLRLKNGMTYHGLSLNVDMDLEPFSRINPCGMAGLAVTQLRDLGVRMSVERATERLAQAFAAELEAATRAVADGTHAEPSMPQQTAVTGG